MEVHSIIEYIKLISILIGNTMVVTSTCGRGLSRNVTAASESRHAPRLICTRPYVFDLVYFLNLENSNFELYTVFT